MHPFLKVAGVKNEKAFYKKYPTQEAFVMDFPQYAGGGTVGKKVTYEKIFDTGGQQVSWSPVFEGFSPSDIKGYWGNIPESMHGLPVARGQEWEELNAGYKGKRPETTMAATTAQPVPEQVAPVETVAKPVEVQPKVVQPKAAPAKIPVAKKQPRASRTSQPPIAPPLFDSKDDTRPTRSGEASPIMSMLDYMRGKPVSFGRESFSPEQKAILYRTALAARKRSGKMRGGTEYEDYRNAVSPEEYQKIAKLKAGKAGFASALSSMTSPGFGVASTLGRFSYATDPKTGETVVTDNYDFSNKFSKKGKVTMEGKSVGEQIYGKFRNLLSAQDAEKGIPDNRIQFRLYPSDTMSKKKSNRFANLYAAGGKVCHECEQEAAMRLAQYLSGGRVKKYAAGSKGVEKMDPLDQKYIPDFTGGGMGGFDYEPYTGTYKGLYEPAPIINYVDPWDVYRATHPSPDPTPEMVEMTGATPAEKEAFAAAEPVAAANVAAWKKTLNSPEANVTTGPDNQGLANTAGNMVGYLGAAVGTLGPLLSTIKQRRGDKPNVNPFLRFGREGLEANQLSQNLVSAGSAAARQAARIRANTAKASNRLGASSINTLRALDVATDFNNDVVNTGIESSEAQNMINLLSARTNLLNQRDQVVMGGEFTRDQADRRDRDAYFTALARNLADAGTMIQQQGKNINQQTLNRQEMGLMNELSKYGLGFKQVGNDLVLTKVK